MVFALLFTLYFAFCGLLLRALVFPKERGLRALWLGLVLGLFGLSWLPALFAFATGRFSLLENLLGALLMGLLAGAGVYYARKQGRCLLKGLSLHREECARSSTSILSYFPHIFCSLRMVPCMWGKPLMGIWLCIWALSLPWLGREHFHRNTAFSPATGSTIHFFVKPPAPLWPCWGRICAAPT